MLKIKRLRAGFYLNALSLVACIVAMIMFLYTYGVFSYQINRWVFTMTFIAVWGLAFMCINTLIVGEKPFWVSYINVLTPFLILLSAILFISPCLSPIGIYFTVGNMGDVETNAVGVPAAITTAIIYVVALLLNVVASFFKLAKEDE